MTTYTARFVAGFSLTVGTQLLLFSALNSPIRLKARVTAKFLWAAASGLDDKQPTTLLIRVLMNQGPALSEPLMPVGCQAEQVARRVADLSKVTATLARDQHLVNGWITEIITLVEATVIDSE